MVQAIRVTLFENKIFSKEIFVSTYHIREKLTLIQITVPFLIVMKFFIIIIIIWAKLVC